jgi:hypothetical protein
MPAVVVHEGVVTVWDRWFPARPTSVNAAMTVLGALMLLSSTAFLAMMPLIGVLHLAIALALMILPWVHSEGRRKRRLAPLRAAGIVSPHRLAELRRTATRSYPPTDVPDQMPFNQGELLLFTTLHLAEQSIADDDLARAVELVRPRLADPNAFVSPMAYGWSIAASRIRTCAIVGKSSGLAQAEWRFAEEPASARTDGPRSGHGNHPVALALAQSLADALGDRWTPAAAAFTAAARGFDRIALDDGEQRIYGELARALQARGLAIPPPLRALLDASSLPSLAGLLAGAQSQASPLTAAVPSS